MVQNDLGEFYDFVNAYGEIMTTRYILSIYGHLRPSQDRDGEETGLAVGDMVTSSTIVGFVNDDKHNGDGAEHLHLGIRLSDMPTAIKKDPRGWFRGYEKSTTFGTDFAAGSEVIDILMAN